MNSIDISRKSLNQLEKYIGAIINKFQPKFGLSAIPWEELYRI